MESEEREKSIVPADSKPLKRYEENIEIVSTSTIGEGIDPYTYLQIIWKHKTMGLIFFAVVVGTALAVSLLTKPMYLAQSTVEIALERPKVVAFEEVLEVNTSDPEFFNTQRDLIQSRSMAEAVLSRFNLWDHPEFYTWQPLLNPVSIMLSYAKRVVRTIKKSIELVFAKPGDDGSNSVIGETDWEKIERDGVISVFLSRVKVKPSQDSRIITIGFEAYSPTFAAKMADAIADTFVEWSLDRKLEATRNAREFLQRQIKEVKSALEKSEAALHQFSVDNDIVSLDKDMNLVYSQLETLNSSLAQATAEKTAKESLYKSVESANPNTILEVTSDPLIQDLKNEYNKLLVEYSNLSALFKPEYPPLKQLQAKIDEVRARLNEETKRRVAAIKADYQTALKKEEGLKKRLEEQEKLAMALNEKTIQYRILEREVQSNKSIYESLLQRFKETDVTGGIQSSGIQVLDRAPIPTVPFKPNTTRNLMLAAIVGLIGAVGIAFLREFLDRTIKTPEEITERMRLPVLGAILRMPENKRYKRLTAPTEKLYLADPRSPFSEAIRTIRASIMLSSDDHSLRSILITSCWPNEGKTTVATNLALSLAYGSNRVLLIEADLRHPGVGKIFGIDESRPGLSNYLMFNSELDEVIHSTDIPQLFVLPVGSIIPSNPSELLQSEEMKQLLDRLRDDFDYLVIDSSPAIGLADSLMLSTITDATVLVASAGITMQRDISHVVRQLSNVKARFLGVVINRLDSARDAYYYRYDYYYKDRAQDKKIEIRKK
jgi:capsular exopolysaccharide synthesis family protein